MKKTILVKAVLLSVLSMKSVASEVTIPNTFSSGEQAVAAEVNDNFNAVKNAVDDNFNLINNNSSAIANNTDAIDDLSSEVGALGLSSGVAAAGVNSSTALSATDSVVRTVTVTPPADGQVIFHSSAWFNCTSSTTCVARCSINPRSTSIDTSRFAIATVLNGQFQTLAITGSLPVTVDEALTLNMVCDTFTGSGSLGDANITVSFSAFNIEQSS